MKSKAARNIFQNIVMFAIIAWLSCFFMGYSTAKTESIFRISLIAIVVLSFIMIFVSGKWWQRIIWNVIFLVFLVVLIFWTGWDQAQFQF